MFEKWSIWLFRENIEHWHTNRVNIMLETFCNPLTFRFIVFTYYVKKLIYCVSSNFANIESELNFEAFNKKLKSQVLLTALPMLLKPTKLYFNSDIERILLTDIEGRWNVSGFKGIARE